MGSRSGLMLNIGTTQLSSASTSHRVAIPLGWPGGVQEREGKRSDLPSLAYIRKIKASQAVLNALGLHATFSTSSILATFVSPSASRSSADSLTGLSISILLFAHISRINPRSLPGFSRFVYACTCYMNRYSAYPYKKFFNLKKKKKKKQQKKQKKGKKKDSRVWYRKQRVSAMTGCKVPCSHLHRAKCTSCEVYRTIFMSNVSAVRFTIFALSLWFLLLFFVRNFSAVIVSGYWNGCRTLVKWLA